MNGYGCHTHRGAFRDDDYRRDEFNLGGVQAGTYGSPTVGK